MLHYKPGMEVDELAVLRRLNTLYLSVGCIFAQCLDTLIPLWPYRQNICATYDNRHKL